MASLFKENFFNNSSFAFRLSSCNGGLFHEIPKVITAVFSSFILYLLIKYCRSFSLMQKVKSALWCIYFSYCRISFHHHLPVVLNLSDSILCEWMINFTPQNFLSNKPSQP